VEIAVMTVKVASEKRETIIVNVTILKKCYNRKEQSSEDNRKVA
jgi:hypothetical protein